jgi:hypothetical protein
MSQNNLQDVVNEMAADGHAAAVRAVAALTAGDSETLFSIIGAEYMRNLGDSGLMDGMTTGEAVQKILGHQTADPFTLALLGLAADRSPRGTVVPLRLVGAPADSGPEA